MLANERFVANAPPEVVEAEREKLERFRRDLEALGWRSSALRAGVATGSSGSLSPWPEEFGLERMRALLAALGEPQRAFPAIHVVGTNGKTSTTLMCAALLRADGLRVGAYISPHVRGWSRADPGRRRATPTSSAALARVRPHAAGATQFEVLTAAALAEFAAREVDVAVVEAGLGGRLRRDERARRAASSC